MQQTEPFRMDLTLELASVADPPSGRIVAGGTSHPFSGWMGLSLALEAVIDQGRTTTEE